jgi:hypothetical protein
MMLRSQGEPKVIAFVQHDLDRPTILTVVVQNIGRDIAHDVRFESSRPVPSKAFGMEPPATPHTLFMTNGFLVDGIPALGPGDSRTTTWGQFAALHAALGGEPIRLTYTYRHGRRKLEGQSMLEVESYRGTDAADTPRLTNVRSLKKISEQLKRLADSVDTVASRRPILLPPAPPTSPPTP